MMQAVFGGLAVNGYSVAINVAYRSEQVFPGYVPWYHSVQSFLTVPHRVLASNRRPISILTET